MISCQIGKHCFQRSHTVSGYSPFFYLRNVSMEGGGSIDDSMVRAISVLFSPDRTGEPGSPNRQKEMTAPLSMLRSFRNA